MLMSIFVKTQIFRQKSTALITQYDSGILEYFETSPKLTYE